MDGELPIAAFDAAKLSDDTRSRLSVCDPHFFTEDNGSDPGASEASLEVSGQTSERAYELIASLLLLLSTENERRQLSN